MPTGKTLTSPVLSEAKIEKLRLKLASEISWSNYTSLGIAKRMPCPKSDGSGTFFAPMVEQAYKKDYFSCFPDDRYNAFSFFYIPNGERIGLNSHHGATHRSLDVDLILYVDMYAIDSSLSRDITHDISKSIQYIILKKHLVDSFEIKEIYDRIEDVYSDFDYREIHEKFLHPQFTVLRFRMELQYTDTIYSQVTFTP